MNESQEQLLHLLRLMIHGGAPDSELLSRINANELFKLACQQHVFSVLVPVIDKYQVELDEGTGESWKRIIMAVASQQLQFIDQIKIILNLLTANCIPAISLKGLVLKQLYSQPELRNMGDLDLLINIDDLPKSIELLRTLGYEIPSHINMNDPRHMHIAMYNPTSLAIELHKTLWHPRFMEKRDNQIWFKHIWANKRLSEFEGIQFTALSPDDELINLVIHIATHLIYSGASLRMLCDFTLFLKTYQDTLDLDYIKHTIKAMDLLTFFHCLLQTCHLTLGLEIPFNISIIDNNKSEMLINDIFNVHDLTDKTTEDWLTLSRRYPSFRNNRLFMPAAFILEVGRQVIKKRKNLFCSIASSKKYFEAFRTRARLLKNIGLHVKINRDF